MHEKGEAKELVSTILYSLVFAMTLTTLIYSIYNFPPDEKLGFFEKQQIISRNFQLVLFLMVIAMTMLVSLMMLLTNIFLADQTSSKAAIERIDSKVKGELYKEIEQLKTIESQNSQEKINKRNVSKSKVTQHRH